MVKNLSFHVMVKPRGAVCNLDCQYCFYLRKEQLYPGSSLRMSDTVLEAYTRQMIEAQQAPEVTFAWQGGEPTLMGLGFFQKAVSLQEKYRKPGMRMLNALQTNATLLDEDWCRFLHDQHFLVGVSLAQRIEGWEAIPVPFSTAIGALTRHVSEHSERDYSPMNVTFGLFDDADVPPIRDRARRREEICRRALAAIAEWSRLALGDRYESRDLDADGTGG